MWNLKMFWKLIFDFVDVFFWCLRWLMFNIDVALTLMCVNVDVTFNINVDVEIDVDVNIDNDVVIQ